MIERLLNITQNICSYIDLFSAKRGVRGFSKKIVFATIIAVCKERERRNIEALMSKIDFGIRRLVNVDEIFTLFKEKFNFYR